MMLYELLEQEACDLSRECDYCRDLYIIEDGYSSLADLDLGFCCDECAEAHEDENEDEY